MSGAKHLMPHILRIITQTLKELIHFSPPILETNDELSITQTGITLTKSFTVL